MKVIVMVKASKGSEAGEMPSEQLLTDMGNYNEELVKAGIMLAGEGLHPSSKGKRVLFSGKERTVTDGPFAETKELLAGFWIWKVNSMDEAVEWVKRCPNPMMEDSEIEIRPIFTAEDFGAAMTPELKEQEASLRAQTLGLEQPRFEALPEILVAGPNAHYTMETRMKIPEQWRQFAPSIGKLPEQVGKSAYGVCWNSQPDCSFDYLTGVEVSDTSKLPAGYSHLQIPAGRYAVFTHSQHISQIGETLEAIWQKWVPDCGLAISQGPCFERYSEEFDPEMGLGGTEIWVPLQG